MTTERLIGPVCVNGLDLSVKVTGTTPHAVGVALLREMIVSVASRS